MKDIKLINTKYKEGYIKEELEELIKINDINVDDFNKAMGVNTATIIDGDMISHHCDVENALSIVINNKRLFWD